MFYSYGKDDAGKLAEALGVSVVFPYANDDKSDKHSHSVLRAGRMTRFVNYGCRASRACLMPDSLNFNAETAMSKVRSFGLFDAVGVRHPALIDPATYKKNFIGRADGKSQGRGMYLYRPGQALRTDVTHDFFVEELPYLREYRLHVFGGQIILSANKIVPYNFRGIARNHKNGCTIKPGIVKNMPKEAAEMAVRAVDAVGLDFGAVDVFETPGGVPYILEVNTAPGLEFKASIAAYVEAFKPYVR